LLGEASRFCGGAALVVAVLCWRENAKEVKDRNFHRAPPRLLRLGNSHSTTEESFGLWIEEENFVIADGNRRIPCT